MKRERSSSQKSLKHKDLSLTGHNNDSTNLSKRMVPNVTKSLSKSVNEAKNHYNQNKKYPQSGTIQKVNKKSYDYM